MSNTGTVNWQKIVKNTNSIRHKESKKLFDKAMAFLLGAYAEVRPLKKTEVDRLVSLAYTLHRDHRDVIIDYMVNHSYIRGSTVHPEFLTNLKVIEESGNVIKQMQKAYHGGRKNLKPTIEKFMALHQQALDLNQEVIKLRAKCRVLEKEL